MRNAFTIAERILDFFQFTTAIVSQSDGFFSLSTDEDLSIKLYKL